MGEGGGGFLVEEVALGLTGPFDEPDLVLPVGGSGVGVPSHDEGVIQVHLGGIQNLRHCVDLL